MAHLHKRIVVIGSSCAGKTTFAKKIAARLGIPHVELDALFWEAGWKEASTPIFQGRVRDAVAGNAWVIDGNYTSRVQDILWPRADLVVWLDTPLPTVMKRFFVRSFSRAWKKEELWNGCRENLRNSIFQKNSLLAWIVKTHGKQRARYLENAKGSPYPNLRFVTLRNAAQAENFLDQLNPPAEPLPL